MATRNPWTVDPDGRVNTGASPLRTAPAVIPAAPQGAVATTPPGVQPGINRNMGWANTPMAERVGPAAPPVVTDVTPKTPGSALRGLGNAFSRGTAAVGGALEALNTGRDVMTPGMTGIDQTARVAEGVGRVAGAGVGAAAGATAGSVVPVVGTALGGLAGGALGYFAPDLVNRGINALTGSQTQLASDRAAELRGPGPTAAAPTLPTTTVTAQGPLPGYQAERLRAMGVGDDVQRSAPIVDSSANNTRDVLRTRGTAEYQNLGNYGGNANIFGRSSNGTGRINDFAGVGAGASPGDLSNRNAIPGMSRDQVQSILRAPTVADSPGRGLSVIGDDPAKGRLDSEIRSAFSRPGAAGNGIKAMLALEQIRAGERNNSRSNDTSITNNENTNATSRANNDATVSASEANSQRTLLSNAARLQYDAQKDARDARSKAAATGREIEEKGFDRYSGAIGDMFTVTGKDGKQTVDKGAQERFRSFIEASDPQAGEKFAAMPPQQQSVLLQNFKTMFDQNEARNKTAASSFTGSQTNRIDLPTDVGEATWNDVWNNNLPLKDYVWSNLPMTDRNVVRTQSGQAVPYVDYTSTRGERDLDKEKIVRDSVAAERARRSPLRSN